MNKLPLLFGITFVQYLLLSAVRQPLSIVKSTLRASYTPFDSDAWGALYLGLLDTSFVSTYALGSFGIASLQKRLVLTRWNTEHHLLMLCMVGTGITSALFGLGQIWNIHHIAYFIIVQLLSGLVHSCGWPLTLSVMSEALDGYPRSGLLLGIWNVHASAGNVAGKLTTGALVVHFAPKWGAAFLTLGLICALSGILLFLFAWCIVIQPSRMENITSNATATGADVEKHYDDDSTVVEPHTANTSRQEDLTAASWKQIVSCAPEVTYFAMCLFFVKMVAYALAAWVPFYLMSEKGYSLVDASRMTSALDVGGFLGGIVAGACHDRWNMPNVITGLLLVGAIPCMWCLGAISVSTTWLIVVMLGLVGFCLYGPFSLISSAVSIQLAGVQTLPQNAATRARINGFINGAGSLGACLQGIVIGIFGSSVGWSNVFILLLACCAVSATTLTRGIYTELRRFKNGATGDADVVDASV